MVTERRKMDSTGSEEGTVIFFNGSADYFLWSVPQLPACSLYLALYHFSSVLDKMTNIFTVPPCTADLVCAGKSCCLFHIMSCVLPYI